MLRFLPPHLMALTILLVIVVWFLLLRYFRQNHVIQRFVAEVFGDNTPEYALWKFTQARETLAGHLNNPHLDEPMRRQIEQALGGFPDETPSAESSSNPLAE